MRSGAGRRRAGRLPPAGRTCRGGSGGGRRVPAVGAEGLWSRKASGMAAVALPSARRVSPWTFCGAESGASWLRAPRLGRRGPRRPPAPPPARSGPAGRGGGLGGLPSGCGAGSGRAPWSPVRREVNGGEVPGRCSRAARCFHTRVVAWSSLERAALWTTARASA